MKRFIGLFVFILMLISFSFTSYAKVNENDRLKEIDEGVTSYVYGDMTVTKQHIKTINNGTTDPKSKNYFWNSHTVQWVDFNTNEDYKIVTYSGSNADKWKQLTTRQACEMWERENPGWIVVAGINGDFFENSGNKTYQPTGNFMTQGDMFRPEKAGASYRNTIGWNKDGSVIVGDPSISSSMYLRLYNNDKTEIVSNTKIASVNKTTVSSSGITLITKDTKNSVDLTGCNVYVCKYDICRLASGGSVFVKGSVVKTDNSVSSIPENGYFYLVDKDGSLSSLIKVGDYLKCEYVYEGDWANVENSMGYVYQTLDNGKTCEDECGDAFCYTAHPRTLIGFKEDGSTVLMVVDGRGTEQEMKTGATISECGELLKATGCINGYNLDGGGSSTLVVRNEFGGFDVINTPSDGSERSDGNHVLVVKRDPGFIVDTDDSTAEEMVVNLSIKKQQLFDQLKNVKISVNGVTKDYKAGGVKFDKLTEETTYEVEVTYDILDVYGKNIVNSSYIVYGATPKFESPEVGFVVSSKTDNSVTFSRDMNVQGAQSIQDIVIHLGDNTYKMNSLDKFTCEDLFFDTEYEVYFEYNVKSSSGVLYPFTTVPFNVKTLAYKAPNIVDFKEAKKTDSYVSVEYQYKDTDRVVKEVYVLVNGEKQVLTDKYGTIKLENLETTDYTIQLVLVYGDENYKLESSVLEFKHTKTEDNPPVNPTDPVDPKPTKKKCGKKNMGLVMEIMMASSLLYIIMKKRKNI